MRGPVHTDRPLIRVREPDSSGVRSTLRQPPVAIDDSFVYCAEAPKPGGARTV